MLGLQVVRYVGQFVRESSQTAGYALTLAARVFVATPSAFQPRRMRDILDLLYAYVLAALPVTALVALVIGMILALNTGKTLVELGQESRIGWLVSATMVREMGPLMTAFILAASLGSGVAAEIGTMKISEEIDALEIMTISPLHFLILPRVVAITLVCPAMTTFADIIGTYGGALISNVQYDVSFRLYQQEALENLEMKDLVQSVGKAAVFGLTIALVASTQGMLTTGGATGVGRATRHTVVTSFLLVLILGYIITWFVYR
ncbi:MAG: MlaE family ABC transporter permease [Planctomycetota bacterium]